MVADALGEVADLAWFDPREGNAGSVQRRHDQILIAAGDKITTNATFNLVPVRAPGSERKQFCGRH